MINDKLRKIVIKMQWDNDNVEVIKTNHFKMNQISKLNTTIRNWYAV